jgi:hypothetical protein
LGPDFREFERGDFVQVTYGVVHQNAFSQKLAQFGFNIYAALVVDQMHEFELGVWKALFKHLIRILYSVDASLVNELDRRCVLSPH